MQRQSSRQDQIRGCILGGALGDAWGRPSEGLSARRPFEVPSYTAISDDTQLTLATCESIAEIGCVQPEHLAARFADWFKTGRITGMGASTLKAMQSLSAGTHWALAGSRGEYAAGNGAAMRVAPLAFLLDPASKPDRVLIRDVCRITHHNDEAFAGSLAVVAAIRAALEGTASEDKSFLLAASRALPDCAVRDRINELLSLDALAEDMPSRFGTSGWVVDSVPLALWCAESIFRNASVTSVLERAIKLGGDTDTMASIAGQIAGAVVGANDELEQNLSSLSTTEDVAGVATRFAAFVVSRTKA